MDLHKRPFDEGTLTKLELFEDYAQVWIPTFVVGEYYKTICIFDLFAGMGYDIAGTQGSSIRLLNQILKQAGNIFKYNVKINVYLNEFNKDKFEALKKSCTEYVAEHTDLHRLQDAHHLNITFYNEDVAQLFPKILPIINKYPSLVYLDQNGIKFISDTYLLSLEKSKCTDFIYYFSSSYLSRFGTTPEFKKFISIDVKEIQQQPYRYIHQTLLSQLKAKLPKDTKLALYPFSIKKGSNIYGIIFGTSHIRGVEKFLNVAWKRNETNGLANFDIDNDAQKIQLDLFTGKQPTKRENFEHMLRKGILDGEIVTNKDVYDFTLQQGHILKHATPVIRNLKKEGKISYDTTQPLISYKNTYGKDKHIVKYTLKK